MTRLGRYTVYQIPGIVVVGVALWALWPLTGWSNWLGAVVLGLWIAKDIALYPLLKAAYDPIPTDDPARLLGREALVIEALCPIGHVKLGAERWRAECCVDGLQVASGQRVRIDGVEGLTLRVSPLDARPDR